MAVAILWLGCSGAPLPAPKAREVVHDAERASFVSPARWDVHPSAPLSSIAATKMSDGRCLFTSEGGQRWTSAVAKVLGSRVVCTGPAEASPAVASEELVAITRRSGGAWAFVGDSGTIFEAAEPLGPFVRRIAAPEPLAKVATAGAGIFATTWNGKLVRWDEAKGWAAPPPSPALDERRVFDVVSGSGGRLLALAFPEALVASEDEGSTWSVVKAPTVGARRLGSTGAGDLGAQGVFDSIVWRGSAFVRSAERVVEPSATLAIEVGRAASMAAFQQGHASLEGDRYYEVVRPDADGQPWILARGRLEGRLESVPIAGTGPCTNLRIGARGSVVVIACAAPIEGQAAIAEARRSDDAGSTWSVPIRLATPDAEAVAIAVNRDGDALVTGVCRAVEAGGCIPRAPVRLTAEPLDAGAPAGGMTLRALSVSAPQLTGPATGPLFSFDGRSAYFVGTRGKDDKASVFVSHDGGVTFGPRLLTQGPRAGREKDDESPGDEGANTFEVEDTTMLRAAEDGTVGFIAFSQRSSYGYLTTDEDLRILQVSTPPLNGDGDPIVDLTYAGCGRRVVALGGAPTATGAVAAQLWESLDGGASWNQQSTPVALAREYGRGGPFGVCAAAGCVLGEAVSRVGWGPTPEEPEEPPAPDAPAHERHVLTPIVCEVASSSTWTRIADVVAPAERSSPLPSVDHLMRGPAVWSVLTADHAKGTATVVRATLPAGGGDVRLTRRQLIGPRAKDTATALVTDQPEGYVAVRASYPTDPKGRLSAGSLRNVEVAWDNVADGSSGHARVADAGRIDASDVSVWTRGAGVLHPTLVLLRGHGVFVRPHAKGKSSLEIFADTSGKVSQAPALALPTASSLGTIDVKADGAMIGRDPLLVGLVRDDTSRSATLLLAKRSPEPGWTYNADALSPAGNRSPLLMTFTTWSRSSASAGFVALVVNGDSAQAWAHYLPLRADASFAPVAPLPTLFDLPATPRACSNADRARDPRAVMPFRDSGTVVFGGARHPVIVVDPRSKGPGGPTDPTVLLTSGAVLHGTPSAPCVAAFEAESAQHAYASAVIGGDPGRSWLFRVAADNPPVKGPYPDAVPVRAIEYRPMSCRYDANAQVPEAVWGQEGTVR